MKQLVSLIFIFSLLFSANVNAQSKQKKKSGKSAKSQTVKKKKLKEKIISAGVVNGRAIYLESPIYPPAARHIGLYGTVIVSVLIDENGDVIDTDVTSGHPILRGSSVIAALNSKFKPIALSGYSVKVRGTVVYHFIPDKYNWLDIGKHLKSARFSEMLPYGFEEEKRLYESYLKSDGNQREPILQTIRALVENKIGNDEKKLWQFQTGILLTEIAERRFYKSENLSESVDKLRMHILNPPEKVSPYLIEILQIIINLPAENSEEFNKQILYFHQNISLLGR